MLPRKQKEMIDIFFKDLYKDGDELRLTIDNGDYRSLLLFKGKIIVEYSTLKKHYEDIFRIIYQVYASMDCEHSTTFDINCSQDGSIFFEVDDEDNLLFGEDKFNPHEKLSFNKKEYLIKTEPNYSKNSFSFSLIENKKSNKKK
jgi:hypothetical protein